MTGMSYSFFTAWRLSFQRVTIEGSRWVYVRYFLLVRCVTTGSSEAITRGRNTQDLGKNSVLNQLKAAELGLISRQR